MRPREIRKLSETEVIRHWTDLYVTRGSRVIGASQYLGLDDIWVEVELPHVLYDADWNGESAELSPNQIARAHAYACRSGPLPPGMASFRDGSKKVIVIDGNHRAHASYLRGDPTARFYMPMCEWGRFLAALGMFV